MTDVARNVRRVLSDPFRGNLSLTDKEREIATLAAKNFTVKEIAANLKISIPMANQHLRFAMQKIGVRHKRDLTRLLIFRVQDATTEA